MTPELEQTIKKALDEAYDKGIEQALILAERYLKEDDWGYPADKAFESFISQLQELKTKEK